MLILCAFAKDTEMLHSQHTVSQTVKLKCDSKGSTMLILAPSAAPSFVVTGMNQARRLGKSFSNVQISKIYASDLKRAHWTALQIATQNASLLSALSSGETSSSSGAANREPEQRGATLASEAGNGLEGETEEDIAETEPGPSSVLSTDRVGSASVDPMSGDAAAPSAGFDPMSGGIVPGGASVTFASAAAVAASPEYDDDFSCSSSAAASSPVRSRAPRISSSSVISASSSSSLSGLSDSLEERLSQTVSTTPLLREQFFGLAEGQNWKTGYATSSSSFHNRGYRFEQGESLQDVHARAEQIMKRCVLPWLVKAAREGRHEHVVLVAHGIVRQIYRWHGDSAAGGLDC